SGGFIADEPATSSGPSIRVEGEPPAIAEDSGSVSSAPSSESALAIAWAYRSRGELTAAREWLARSAAGDATVKSMPLYAYLDNGITLEREYLSKAQKWLRQAYENGELRDSQRGAAAFNLGEIARRLGDSAGALQWYEEAAGKNLGSVSPRLLQRQKKLVTDKSPYA
ncbi:MAG: DUF2225 domain-containing protein, partial [bacterium]|nr:DUF2225 domain-containing protein [bacterium]